MNDKVIFSRDATTAVFRDRPDAGITVDDTGRAEIDWDEVEVVHITDTNIAEQFTTQDFYKLPAVVARPIKQVYQYGDSLMTFVKPREELKKAAWSLDNAPWTHSHPDTKMLKDADDVHGFWKTPRYIDSMDSLEADLHIPVDDTESMEFIEENGDVSVGFYNRVARTDSYDGIVGLEDAITDVDGYQTDLYFDHVASVARGRCSSEQGCGVHDGAGTMSGQNTDSLIKGTLITDTNRGDEETDSTEENVDDDFKNNTTMTDSNTDCGGADDMGIQIDDLSVDAVASKHEGVSEALDEKESRIAELEQELDNATDSVSVKDEQLEDLQEKVDKYEGEQKQELVSEIVERTDAVGTEEELMELDLEAVQDKHTLVMELSVTDKAAAGGAADSDADEAPTFDAPYQRATPWDDN